METSNSISRLFFIVLIFGLTVLRLSNAQECTYTFNTINVPVNTESNGKIMSQEMSCNNPFLDWIDTRFELYTELTWNQPDRDFRLCFAQASNDKIIVRYTDSQRVSQPGYLIPTTTTANENQYCMTSVNRKLEIAFRVASTETYNAVWILTRVVPLDPIYPDTNREDPTDQLCVSRERSISGGEFFDVTFGCSGSNTLFWYDTTSQATTETMKYGEGLQDFTACFSSSIQPVSITQSGANQQTKVVENTVTRQCFESSNRVLELIVRTVDSGTFNGVYMTVEVTPVSGGNPNTNPGENTGETDVGLVGDKCKLVLKDGATGVNTILTCIDTTVTWPDTSQQINPATFTWYRPNEDFTLCFVRASHSIDVQSPQTGQSFRISTTDSYQPSHCVKASSFFVSVSLTISSFTFDTVELVVRLIPATESEVPPSSCSLAYMGVNSFSTVAHCKETALTWYDAQGTLVGQMEWYQGLDFITCIKDSARPLVLNYLDQKQDAVGVIFSSQKYPQGYCMKSQNKVLSFTLQVDGTFPTMPIEMEITPCQSSATCVLPNNGQNEVNPQSGTDDNGGKDTNGDGFDDLMNYSDSTSSGLTATAVILIVLGAVLLLLIIVIFIVAYCHKKNKMESSSDTESVQQADPIEVKK